MIERLKHLVERIDRMALRERALLFAALVTLVALFPYSFSIQPALRRQQLLLERIKQDQSQIKAMQEQLRSLVIEQQQPPDPGAQDKLAKLELRLKDLELEIEDKQRHLVPAEKVSDLLRSIIGKTTRVELLSLSSVAGGKVTPPSAGTESFSFPSGSTAKGSPVTRDTKAAPPPGPDIYKHGVEITLRGSYMDLLSYVTELERSRWRLIWGPITLNVEEYPSVTLRASVYTLSTEPSAFSF